MSREGILLSISSLPSAFGIGTLGAEAYSFVDFLSLSKQRYWQMLPLTMTGYGNSPYQSPSAFSSNIFYIDLDLLMKEGLLHSDDYIDLDWGDDPLRVDYSKIYLNRFKVLYKAYKNFDRLDREYLDFTKENARWLNDYSNFMAVKERFNYCGLNSWDKEYKNIHSDLVKAYLDENSDKVNFYKVTQYFFLRQYLNLKAYANSKGISIIGDMPFYIAYDSSDVWSNPKLFELSEELTPLNVAGVPPDAFSRKGQLWGNPLYDFHLMKAHGYGWWKERFDYSMKLYDLLRIDHFRAFDSYYAIPYKSKDARKGEWRQGVGIEFFNELGLIGKDIIAEDLGIIDDSVRKLVSDTGFYSTRVIQFAFDNNINNEHLTENYNNRCIAYTGTHDNDTLRGWYQSLGRTKRRVVDNYVSGSAHRDCLSALISKVLNSSAKIVIIPMQDYLSLDSTARMNIPATIGGNWEWRMPINYTNVIDSIINLIEG